MTDINADYLKKLAKAITEVSEELKNEESAKGKIKGYCLEYYGKAKKGYDDLLKFLNEDAMPLIGHFDYHDFGNGAVYKAKGSAENDVRGENFGGSWWFVYGSLKMIGKDDQPRIMSVSVDRTKDYFHNISTFIESGRDTDVEGWIAVKEEVDEYVLFVDKLYKAVNEMMTHIAQKRLKSVQKIACALEDCEEKDRFCVKTVQFSYVTRV